MYELCNVVPVDLMPGKTDPSNFALPQQPFNPCLFPQSQIWESFNCVTNPYQCSVDGITLLGTSGQPIADLEKYVTSKEPIELLEDTLSWAHMAPTAPDTLGCYPFYDREPFIIEAAPHIYFTGNSTKFASKLVDHGSEGKTLLICVPSFATTSSLVLVDLHDLTCQELFFMK